MLRVLAPGAQTTVQDLGRPGHGDQGISPAGPMDALALRLGNLIVGNAPDAAALEMTLAGPTLAFEREAVIALAGAPFAARLGRGAGDPGRPLPLWQAVRVRRGAVLSIGGARAGARAYLCVAGGVDVPLVLGSRATHLLAQLGGVDGRAIEAGDTLSVGRPSRPLHELVGRRLRRSLWPTFAPEVAVRVVLGPQAEAFTAEAQAAFLGQPYTVAPDSNRMGVRLTGPALSHVRGADLLSEGIALGAVQVPHSGQPIILMVERQTTGGYTKIATVIGADVRHVGQARPGSRLRFAAVTVEAALAARQAQEAIVDEASIERGAAWGPEDVAAIMDAFAASGLGELRLRARGVRLVLRREAEPPAPSLDVTAAADAPGAEDVAADRRVQVTAPLLGIYYAAPAPDEPPFVQRGDAVAEGQVVALIDVMKTLHPVRAPATGRVADILVESGALVEYGEPLMTLEGGEAG